MTERVLGPRGGRRRRRVLVVPALVILVAAIVFGVTSAVGASLPGSNFEIDSDANLKVNGASPPALDWGNVNETRKADLASGSGDNSFGEGTKEDDAIPTVVDGSIPPNKSDLLNFGVYLETTGSGARFLNLFWHRVQEPNGTTNMDFEFNQSSTLSSNGVTPVRTSGDLLIQYDLSKGGTSPVLWKSTWVTSGASSQCEASNTVPCWSDKVDLTAAGDATGSINTTAIASGDADGLGAISARTFGEAQLDFDALTGGATSCTSFGSAYLKSRSSDSFTSAVKDFIAPTATNLSNCATVIIRKQTDPEENPNATSFSFTKAFTTSPSSSNSFSLTDDGVQTFNNVLFGSGYTVIEGTPPSGWDLSGVDCAASTGVTPGINGATVTFALDAASDILDCTYTNRARGSIRIVKNTVPNTDTTTSFQFNPTGFNGGTSFNLVGHGAGQTFSNLAPGSGYSVTESTLAGWDLTSSSCTNGTPTAITVVAGQTTTCTFTNTKRGTIIVEKQTDPNGASGNFTFTGTAAGTIADNGQIVVSNLVPGQYTSTEADPSPAFGLQSISCDDSDSSGNTTTRVATFNLQAGETVKCTFTNRQLHTVVVLVCHTGTNTLIASDVTLPSGGATTKTSLSTPPSGITQAQLCGLGGATFNQLPHGNVGATVNVGSGTH